MFAAIAPSYDLNNRVHSWGRDQAWRRAAVKVAEVRPSDVVVDVACGTGDFSLAFADAGAARVVGIDFTFNMLAVAGKKGQGPRARGRADGDLRAFPLPSGPQPLDLPSYHAGDAMRLPLADASADVVSIAFGIRNVADPAKAIREFFRVLRPGGRLIILEFSLPTNPVMRGLYNFYFRLILPHTATWIAGDKSGAYKYLPQSVNTFIDRPAMVKLMGEAGFVEPAVKPLTMGIAVVYRGMKRSS
jgi:demethylmenaquinone methyltransferase/2-methoxy-6-polyprenyl-1,4-benzoquinol methylase